ncbi:MAG: class I SAM-dependent methyltransferase [Spirochaetales bacterium]|nr:class I SAM-dependent methyltransferase [Spirochaetales bacterium]
MNIKEYTEANRAAWNEVIPIHRKSSKKNLKTEFSKKGFSVLDNIETPILLNIGIKNRKIAQLCCNDGRELLSMINLGAESGTGFDISDEAIKDADNLKIISGAKCEFIRTDVYEIESKYNNSFDLVYISIGAINWLPDIDKFFSIASRLLKKNGKFFIYEMHPATFMLPAENEELKEDEDPFTIKYSYFSKDPWISDEGIDYVGKRKYKAKTTYEFVHTTSEIINSLISNNIKIELFNEYSHDVSTCFGHIENDKKVPLSFILVGQKE